jgi:hypothetical protein
VLHVLDSHTLREAQNNDGRDEDQLIQDAATLAASDLIGDPNIVSNTDLRQDLQKHIPRTTTVQYRGHGGGEGQGQKSTLTLTKARQSLKQSRKEKRGGFDAPTFGGPSQVPFYSNRTTPVPPAAAAAVSARREDLPDPNRARGTNSLLCLCL